MSIFNIFRKKSAAPSPSKNDIFSSIALSCFNALGYSDTEESINACILSPVLSTNIDMQFTQQYFLEEAAFYLMTLIEAQEAFGTFDNIIKAFNNDTGQGLAARAVVGRDIANKDIVNSIQSSCSVIAGSRIQKNTSTKTLNYMQMIEFLDKRFIEYRDSQVNHLTCEHPMSSDTLNIGLLTREHPTEIYLGNIADNIVASLKNANDSLSKSLIEISLMTEHNNSLQKIALVYGK